MSFNYSKISREDSDKPREYPLLEDGIYRFQVSKATYKLSKNGNHMIELKLTLFNEPLDNKIYTAFDYLINTENLEWKTRHFADSTKLDKYYDDGTFSEKMCPGREGLVKIKIQQAIENPNGGMYPAKHVVEDYVMTMNGEVKSDLSPSAPSAPPAFDDSDITF